MPRPSTRPTRKRQNVATGLFVVFMFRLWLGRAKHRGARRWTSRVRIVATEGDNGTSQVRRSPPGVLRCGQIAGSGNDSLTSDGHTTSSRDASGSPQPSKVLQTRWKEYILVRTGLAIRKFHGRDASRRTCVSDRSLRSRSGSRLRLLARYSRAAIVAGRRDTHCAQTRGMGKGSLSPNQVISCGATECAD